MKSSKPKLWLWIAGIIIFTFFVFVYMPLPGLESPLGRFNGLAIDPDSVAIFEKRTDDLFRQVLESTKLRRPFPDVPTCADNPTTPEKIVLGRLLFFDPLLSADNDLSCAHCHHPDLGFSDNRGQAMGRKGKGVGPLRQGGILLRRSAPTLWDVAYNHRQFWDGRAIDLEEQAQTVIQDLNEMAQDTTKLVKELQSIPEYVRLFETAFGGKNGTSVTFRNVIYAIAAFERTLISNHSAFDRYVNGETTALTAAQRRGLNRFRSLKMRCFECHQLPTFANPDFKVIGVPDLPTGVPDWGRGEMADNRYEWAFYARAFKVPTLRNIALTAPYMHNGIFKTLEEVIDFYAGGGGAGAGLDVPNIDDKIRKFILTQREKEDLIAFLHALTDESNKPEIPKSVPSGLPVVPHLPNQSPELAAYNARAIESQAPQPSRHGKRIIVKAGESIQAGINAAQKGDTVLVMPGNYHEELVLDALKVTILGVNQNGQRPVLDGKNVLSDGLVGSGRDIEIRNFEVRNFTANGLMLNGAVNVRFRDLHCENPGLYGVYPVECINVLIERCRVTGASDAGLYVGQSRDIVVRDSKTYGNVGGIIIENSVNAVVENNEVFDNAGGILVFLVSNTPSKISKNCALINNRVYDNNHTNFAAPIATVSHVPSGTGILILAADEVEVASNEIRNNHSVGVAVLRLDAVHVMYDVDPIPERCWIHDNKMTHNGLNPTEMMKAFGLDGADLVWDLSGYDNSWNQAGAKKVPKVLPNKSWPDIVRRANWRLWQVLAKVMN